MFANQTVFNAPHLIAPGRGQLDPIADGAALLHAVFGLRSFPSLIVEPDLTVVFINDAGKNALSSHGLAILPHGKLQLAHAVAHERLRSKLSEPTEKRNAVGSPQTLAYKTVEGRPRILTIKALSLAKYPGSADARRRLLFEISVRTNLRSLDIAPEHIVDALGLTWAEASLAAALAAGISVQEYAEQQILGLCTVRWHLKNIFKRTGARSQVELVGMLVSLFL